MARRRYISTKLSLDAKVNKLAMTAGDFAALLYTWMIPHAEDDARLSGDPEEILMTVCPGRRDKSPDDVAAALQAMHDLDLIEWHQDEGYVQFPSSFYGYQSYITERRKSAQMQGPSDNPPQTTAKQRKSPQTTASLKSSFSFSSSVSERKEDQTAETTGAPVHTREDTPPPSDDLAQRVQESANLYSRALAGYVQRIAPAAAAANIDLVQEAANWAEKYTGQGKHLNTSSFQSWIDNLLRPDRPRRESAGASVPRKFARLAKSGIQPPARDGPTPIAAIPSKQTA